MDIKIELLGYKGKITHIGHRLACRPWHEEDQLLVHVEFEEPFPASIISTVIPLTPKDYTLEEFLIEVKIWGENDLAISLEKHREGEEKRRREDNRREELITLAEGLESKFGGKK